MPHFRMILTLEGANTSDHEVGKRGKTELVSGRGGQLDI
jgi:hypothetical protein